VCVPIYFVDKMLKEKLIKDLREFGLSEYEAKAYLALAIHGPLSASTLSSLSKIPQSKIYEVLKSLVSKSLAEFWNGRPIRYKAVEPVYALDKLISKKENVISNLKDMSNSIINKLKPIKEEKYGIWSSKGKKAFLEKGSEMILKAEKFGFATTTRFSRYPMLDEAYLKALKRGVKIRMLGTADLDEAKQARARWYAKKGAKIKILPMDIHPILGVVDDKEICVRVDNALDPDFFWSNNPAMINIFGTYFKELWNKGKTFKI